MLTDVMYVTINVTDQDRALRFYTDRLGLEKRVDNPGPEQRTRPSAELGLRWGLTRDIDVGIRGHGMGGELNSRLRLASGGGFDLTASPFVGGGLIPNHQDNAGALRFPIGMRALLGWHAPNGLELTLGAVGTFEPQASLQSETQRSQLLAAPGVGHHLLRHLDELGDQFRARVLLAHVPDHEVLQALSHQRFARFPFLMLPDIHGDRHDPGAGKRPGKPMIGVILFVDGLTVGAMSMYANHCGKRTVPLI